MFWVGLVFDFIVKVGQDGTCREEGGVTLSHFVKRDDKATKFWFGDVGVGVFIIVFMTGAFLNMLFIDILTHVYIALDSFGSILIIRRV